MNYDPVLKFYTEIARTKGLVVRVAASRSSIPLFPRVSWWQPATQH